MSNTKAKLVLSLLASLTLGLAPFSPEPHLFGKLKWVFGGAKGMQLMDWFDLVFHGLPWLFLIYFSWKYFFSKEEEVDIAQLLNEKNVQVIDVREPNEYNAGHYEGAVNFPLSALGKYEEQIKAMEGNKILYCRSGMRSGMAVKRLKSLGIENAYNGGSLKRMLSMAND